MTAIFNAHYDERYKESRKIFTQCLRTLMTSRLGNILATELTLMEKDLDRHLDDSVDISTYVPRVFTNTMTQLFFGKRYSDQGNSVSM